MGSRCELSFIERYSVSEANDLLDDLLSLTKDLSSLVITGTYINKDKMEVRSYLKALNSYVESGIDYSDLKYGYYDEGDNLEAIIHMLEIPITEIPLYLGSKSKLVMFLAKWRLKHGR